MTKHLNLPDMIVIGLSAYIVIWGVNYALRTGNLGGYQA